MIESESPARSSQVKIRYDERRGRDDEVVDKALMRFCSSMIRGEEESFFFCAVVRV